MDAIEAFESIGLDARIVRAASKRGFRNPTGVQQRAIPEALAGKDVVALAGTGSGKTGAYLLPALHCLLNMEMQPGQSPPHVLILVPTSELTSQVKAEAANIALQAGSTARVGYLPPAGSSTGALRAAAAAAPDVLVATPARVAACIRDKYFHANAISKGLKFLVVDEADLLFSYGYEPDVEELAKHVPRSCTSMMVSATKKGEIDRIADMLLNNPSWIEVSGNASFFPDEADTPGAEGEGTNNAPAGSLPTTISHFVVWCKARDKLLYAMAMLKLGLLRKKSLIFVSGAHASVRLRLFLEKFGIPCASVHGEQPKNTRDHVLEQFNRGVYDHLVASERQKGDDEFGVTRGIDFKNVRTVMCMGVPERVDTYIHRAGRTGRAGNKGAVLTLAAEGQEEKRVSQLEEGLREQLGTDIELKRFPKLRPKDVESLRYRGEDVLRSLGRNAVREARLRELRMELLNSKRLAEHLSANPDDHGLLKHDRMLAKSQPPEHLAHLPDYIKPSGMKKEQARKRQRQGASKRGGTDPLKLTRGSYKELFNQVENGPERSAKHGPSADRNDEGEDSSVPLQRGNIRAKKRKRSR